MRHRVKGRTLGRSPSHRAAMLRNLVCSLMLHGKIRTSSEKAKEAKSLAEKLITLGQKGTLHARRIALSRLHNKDMVSKIFEEIAKRNPERKGGHTRILKLDETRLGDNASQVIFELVDAPVATEGETAKVEEKEATEA
jgi:large subunit ribosomal protein L17